MIIALLICVIFTFFAWLVFFKFKWLKFTAAWGVVSAFVLIHVVLAVLIGLRFVTPFSVDAKVIQHTIQLVPRLSEPTLVTAVLVEPNVPVKKGQPLFQFDRRPYEYKVNQLQAQLAQTVVDEAAVRETQAEADRARLHYESEIDGVNTTVAEVEAELDQALYYLDNTTLVAPEDGRIINLQVRPGMVAGDLRVGAIASFICEADRYLLANYNAETLKFVNIGQPVEIALEHVWSRGPLF